MSDEAEAADPSAEARPDAVERTDDDLIDDQADAAEDFLNGLLDIWDVEGEARADVDGDSIYVELEGPDLGLLIGRHGATLDSLQDLVRAAVQHVTESRAILTLDIAGYRERQHEILERDALSMAEKVRREGRSIELDPMNSFERRIVHTALAEVEGVMTESEGEGPDRRVVIRPS